MPGPIPATVLTGFLGSGKTTFLRRALALPALSDTAVVVNEIGAVAIDHHLVDFVEGEVLELPGGCLCCAVREDLARTLRGLVERRAAGALRPFRRIVIETTGLADPAPILYTLGADPDLDAALTLGRIVTVVDAERGAALLDRFAEAGRQAALADVLVVSKTDLAPLGADLAARLDALNRRAERLIGVTADPAAALFGDPRSTTPAQPLRPVAGFDPGTHVLATRSGVWEKDVDGRDAPGHDVGSEHAVHSHGIDAFAIVLAGPISRLDFARALGGLAGARGSDLLRVKGIVQFSDRPGPDGLGRPAVVQAAQHALFAPEWLDAWPDDDRRSRLVFVVHDIAREEVLARFAFAAPALLDGRPGQTHSHP